MKWLVVFTVVIATSLLVRSLDFGWKPLVPTMVALGVVLATRNAAVGLFAGVVSGTILLSDGSLLAYPSFFVMELFLPIFDSAWKISALLFTLILGGFVALMEAGGGLRDLLRRILGSGRYSRKRTQLVVTGFGISVFFDGLANSMLVGRMMRSAVDRSGVSRAKLAYLADTTSSAVACLAFISTWIAFQLSMIREGFEIVGQPVDPYRLFFLSLPANFYCWFALGLAFISILRNFNPGPMGAYEDRAARARRESLDSGRESGAEADSGGHWFGAVVPIIVLIFSVPVVSYLLGAENLLPLTPSTFAEAYGRAEKYVPQIIVSSATLAALAAAVSYALASRPSESSRNRKPGAPKVFLLGVKDLSQPVLILFAAWMLGSVVSQLGAADFLSSMLNGRFPIQFFPVAVFLAGALISFSTGTSWGTMAVLMPLAIPVAFALHGDTGVGVPEELVVAAIAAVFSGAVFGDHCSPFSDTTIVSSIAAGVDPVVHVKTQLSFALISASVAVAVGFIPLGFGVSPWILLVGGMIVLLGVATLPHLKNGKSGG